MLAIILNFFNKYVSSCVSNWCTENTEKANVCLLGLDFAYHGITSKDTMQIFYDLILQHSQE